VLLETSVATICALTFVWPFAVSADPAQAEFRAFAIAAWIGFLAALVLLLACRVRHTSS
jgi:hypothetical protein